MALPDTTALLAWPYLRLVDRAAVLRAVRSRFVLIIYLPVEALKIMIKGKEMMLRGYFNEERKLSTLSRKSLLTLNLPGFYN